MHNLLKGMKLTFSRERCVVRSSIVQEKKGHLLKKHVIPAAGVLSALQSRSASDLKEAAKSVLGATAKEKSAFSSVQPDTSSLTGPTWRSGVREGVSDAEAAAVKRALVECLLRLNAGQAAVEDVNQVQPSCIVWYVGLLLTAQRFPHEGRHMIPLWHSAARHVHGASYMSHGLRRCLGR